MLNEVRDKYHMMALKCGPKGKKKGILCNREQIDSCQRWEGG